VGLRRRFGSVRPAHRRRWLANSRQDGGQRELTYERYRSIDPWTPVGLLQRPLRAFRTRDLLPRRVVEATEFYQAYLWPHRIGGFTGVYVRGRDGVQVALAFHHGADRDALDDEVSRATELAFPRVARAIDVAGRMAGLEARNRDLEATMAALPTPVAWVSRRAPATVAFVNDAASARLRVETGVAVVGDRLVVADARAARTSEAAIPRLRNPDHPLTRRAL